MEKAIKVYLSTSWKIYINGLHHVHGKTQYYKDAIFSTFIYEFQAIPIKILTGFLRNLTSKF